MSKGKVSEYDPKCGFGIIIDFDTGQELTVYANYLDLKEGEILGKGQDVIYDIENNKNVNWAINVRIA